MRHKGIGIHNKHGIPVKIGFKNNYSCTVWEVGNDMGHILEILSINKLEIKYDFQPSNGSIIKDKRGRMVEVVSAC